MHSSPFRGRGGGDDGVIARGLDGLKDDARRDTWVESDSSDSGGYMKKWSLPWH